MGLDKILRAALGLSVVCETAIGVKSVEGRVNGTKFFGVVFFLQHVRFGWDAFGLRVC